MMKKNLKPIIYYATVFFGLFWAKLSDSYAEKYQLYYLFDKGTIEYKTIILFLGVYPACAMMIINWFPYTKSIVRKMIYLMGWTIFSTFYEWVSLMNGIVHFVNWNIWYSALSYPPLYGMLILNIYFIKRLMRERIQTNPPPV